MQRRHRRKGKQRKIIIISFVCLMTVMTVGYAAFNTRLNIHVKGNVLDSGITIEELKNKAVTTGDGLYADTAEDGRYIYKGVNPDNYITFNNEEYRIISIETDGTLKIVKSESLGNRNFADAGVRPSDYCNTTTAGCNVWGNSTTMLDVNGNNITAMPTAVGGTALALPAEEAQIATYLNTDYYETLSPIAKSQIDTHLWNAGMLLAADQTLETDIAQEKNYKWRGKIGLINPSDYVKASTASSCTNAYVAYSHSSPCSNPVCSNSNYLYDKTAYWTISPYSNTDARYVWRVDGGGCFEANSANNRYGVRPAIYLTSYIKLSGQGTSNKPFVIIYRPHSGGTAN